MVFRYITAWVKTQNREPRFTNPMNQDKQYKIGVLVKTDPDFDAALFRFETERRIEAKVAGEPDDFEPGEPIEPKRGMKVECFGRRNHAMGQVMYVGSWNADNNRTIREVHIRVADGFITCLLYTSPSPRDS